MFVSFLHSLTASFLSLFSLITLLPTYDDHGDLTVSYADYGIHKSEANTPYVTHDDTGRDEIPVVLFMLSMYA